MAAVIHRVLTGCTRKILPSVLKESVPEVISADQDDLDDENRSSALSSNDDDVVTYPWHHPYKQILRTDYEVTNHVILLNTSDIFSFV